MKTQRPLPLLLCLLAATCAAGAEELAAPLRKYDKDKDGKLTGEELVQARQAHRRGGRDAEPNPGRWREILERVRGGWEQRHAGKFDKDGGGLSPDERKEMEAAWKQTAERITMVRDEILKKYDRNDDGELNDSERGASRQESERRRLEVEQEVLAALGKTGGTPAPGDQRGNDSGEKRVIPPPRS